MVDRKALFRSLSFLFAGAAFVTASIMLLHTLSGVVANQWLLVYFCVWAAFFSYADSKLPKKHLSWIVWVCLGGALSTGCFLILPFVDPSVLGMFILLALFFYVWSVRIND